MEEIKKRIIELRKDVDFKWQQYLIAEEALIQEPLFFDKAIKDRFFKAKEEWEIAVNNHNQYLKFLIDEGHLNNGNAPE